jgi:hypothetical protein
VIAVAAITILAAGEICSAIQGLHAGEWMGKDVGRQGRESVSGGEWRMENGGRGEEVR